MSDIDTEEAGMNDDTPRETEATRGTSLFAVAGAELVSPLTLVFVRHGVTDHTVTHVLSGSSEPGPHLNAAGKVQAAKAADAVHRIGRETWMLVPKVDRLIASPMTRTQETGEALGRRLGLKVETDDRLKEIHFGEWDGLTGEHIAREFGDAIHRWQAGAIAAPGGESIPDVGERLDGFMVEVAREHAAACRAGEDVPRAYALASHAVAIKSAVAKSMKMDPAVWGNIWPQPASISILQLRITTDGEIAQRHLLCLGHSVE